MRTERDSDSRRREVADLLVLPRAYKMAQTSAEKLEHTVPSEKERVATERAVGKNSRAAFAKRKRNRAVSPEYQIMEGRVKVDESRTFVRIQCQKGKESNSSRGKRRVFLCRRTVKVKVGGKAIPASFLKVKGRGAIGRRERDR